MISAGPRHESELIRALTHLDDKEQKLLKYIEILKIVFVDTIIYDRYLKIVRGLPLI